MRDSALHSAPPLLGRAARSRSRKWFRVQRVLLAELAARTPLAFHIVKVDRLSRRVVNYFLGRSCLGNCFQISLKMT
jgi:hypothetical protein